MRPSLLGAAYLTSLTLWATRSPEADERELGTQARQIEAFVAGQFGHEVSRIALAVVAAAAVIGAALGLAAGAMVSLHDRLHGRSTRRPVERAIPVLGLVVATHAALELHAMATAPQLYAAAWYARGGWRRTVQVLATEVFGPSGVTLAFLLGLAALFAGPPSQWPRWTSSLARWARKARTITRLVASPWRRRVAIGIGGAVAVTLAVTGGSLVPVSSANAGGRAEDMRPNVLILAADSLRADRLNARTAPHLTALAARGARFDRAYVSLPRTFPSWVTLLTGRYPHHHGIRSMFPSREDRARDFDAAPERLARAGYATGVVSDYAGDVFSRIDLGFDRVDVPEFDFRQVVRQRVLERETPLLPFLHSRAGRAVFPVLREMNDAADPAMLAADAVRAIHALESRGPFFLVVFFSTAHFPYAAPWPYYGRFTDPSYRGRFKYHKPVGLGHDGPADLDDERQVRALYDGAVLAIDDAAQTVLDALSRDGIAKRTVVVLTADHGETLYESGHGLGHGDHLFGDEATHIPLVIVDPRGATVPTHESTIARDVDLAPTLYALAGVPPPADLDGRSLVPALLGQPLAPALAFAETGLWFTEDIPGLPADLRLPYPGIERITEIDRQYGDEIVLSPAVRPLTIVAKHRMVRDERYKLVYVPARQGVRWLLFDTLEDPSEERDVAAAHPEVVGRLQSELWTWMRQDKAMTERGGYLVPSEPAADAQGLEAGVVRLAGDSTSAPESKASP